MVDANIPAAWQQKNFADKSPKELYAASNRATRNGYHNLAGYLKAIADEKYGVSKGNDLEAIKDASERVRQYQAAAYAEGNNAVVIQMIFTSSKGK